MSVFWILTFLLRDPVRSGAKLRVLASEFKQRDGTEDEEEEEARWKEDEEEDGIGVIQMTLAELSSPIDWYGEPFSYLPPGKVSRPWTLDPGPGTLDRRVWRLDPRPLTLDP
eukprot:1604705-Rhodomonas_salina.2